MGRKLLITGGLLLLAAALFLTAGSLLADRAAGAASGRALAEVGSQLAAPAEEAEPPAEPAAEDPAWAPDPDREMPETEADGRLWIGVVEIPSLALELPVMSRWSYPNLRVAPCRYRGSAYRGDLILLAHNYSRHFGKIGRLAPGDTVRFTDAEGNRFTYAVSQVEQLDGTDVEAMERGDWDLTLFTCTVGGGARVTVRCALQSAEGAVPPLSDDRQASGPAA